MLFYLMFMYIYPKYNDEENYILVLNDWRNLSDDYLGES